MSATVSSSRLESSCAIHSLGHVIGLIRTVTLLGKYKLLPVEDDASILLSPITIRSVVFGLKTVQAIIIVMGIKHFDELPAEIRLYIFRLATIKISQHEDTRLDYRPFEAVALYNRDWSSSAQQALDVKRTVVLVSKEWKKIATEMLYECIRVRHSTDSLIEALEGPLADEPGVDGDRRTFDNGRWVRRVEISPEIMDFDPFHPLPLLRIMQSCPLAECIVRPCVAISGGAGLGKVRAVPFPTFPNVKRIEWWIPSSMPRSSSDGMDTGLPGFLGQLVNHCPNVQYLTLSASFDRLDRAQPNFRPPRFIGYPNIQTIRLEGEDGSLPLPHTGLYLPGLRNLVLGIANTPAQWILQKNGHQVRVLEFISVDFPAYARYSYVAGRWTTKDVFDLCPNIEELCVSLNMGDSLARQNEKGVILHALKCIRVKFYPGLVIQATQLAVFLRDRLKCPALERIVLHGKEDEWRENASFPMLKSYVERLSYVTLEFA